MDKLYDNSDLPAGEAGTGCCPRFDPKPWDGKEITWEGKLFLKDHVRSFLHIPLNFGQVVVRDMEKVETAGALSETPLMLSEENSLFGSDIYIAVAKDVPEAQMDKISGTFLSKVFEGPFQNTGRWAKEMQKYVLEKGKNLKKMYFFYTTCPACVKHYGKNYVVLLAQI